MIKHMSLGVQLLQYLRQPWRSGATTVLLLVALSVCDAPIFAGHAPSPPTAHASQMSTDAVLPARTSHASSAPLSQGSFSLMRYLDAGEKFFRILAYIIGGAWVFFNYKKGRIYRPRLELRLSGDFKQIGVLPVLVTTLQIKNISLAKVEIQQYGTAFTESR